MPDSYLHLSHLDFNCPNHIARLSYSGTMSKQQELSFAKRCAKLDPKLRYLILLNETTVYPRYAVIFGAAKQWRRRRVEPHQLMNGWYLE